MKIQLLGAALLLLVASRCCSSEMLDIWKNDIRRQPLASRPKIEARYIDATRTGLDIEAQNYRAQIALKSDGGQRIASFKISSPKGPAEILGGKGAYLQLTTSDGTLYSTLNSRKPSRINIYRRGPYYIETHWLDVLFTSENAKAAPIKGEVVLYSYPEKTHIAVILHVTDSIDVKSAAMVFAFDAETCASPTDCKLADGMRINEFMLVKRAESAPTCAMVYPVPAGVDDVTIEKVDGHVTVSNFIYNHEAHNGATASWKAGDKQVAYFEVFPTADGDVTPELEAEVQPLLSASMVAKSGRTLGYDPVRGCYKVQTDNPGGFSYHYYTNTNAYEVAEFSILNTSLARKIYVMHETNKEPGSVECGVVLDEAGNTLPITVQISKNFAGEKEEPFYNPDDTPFSETFFPLHLEAGESRKLTSLHLYQNWGSHPLKQFSSLGAWMDYYHMSTGVTETTCYVPFLFGGLDGVSIADLRPMSQKMWESQPQHDNVAGHSFLRYMDDAGKWHFVEYTGTTFRSTGPNWADMSLSYLSDDGKAKVTIDVFELPQTDELRNFMHMRVDFLGDIKLKDDDPGKYVRFLNIASWVQRMRYTHVALGGPTGDPEIVPIRLTDDYSVIAAPLPTENGFATVYPDKAGANAYIVHRFEGKIGGEPAGPGVTVYGQKDGNTVLSLVPVNKAKEIKAGDFIEADLFIMPYGGGTQDAKPPQKAALDFGLNAPKVTKVELGRKISDFPTRIALDDNGVAEFAITGGMNYIPIIVEGAKDYACQRIYNVDSGKTLIDHAQKGERDGYQVFAKDDGTFGFVFLVNTDGQEHKYRVE